MGERMRLLSTIVGAVLALGILASPAFGEDARLREAVRQLPVARETNAGYDRDKFRHWVDSDGDCEDTRAEVLITESRTATTGDCTIVKGRWFSYYDRETWTAASDVDIDHLVALAEAWGSGAKRWTSGTRQRFANDLRDPRALVAVTDNVNQSKSDRDPAEWLPEYGKCRYVREWVAVKLRWQLRVNWVEKRRLVDLAGDCRNSRVRWRPARVEYR
jgi:uncharacterized protein DUF1524